MSDWCLPEQLTHLYYSPAYGTLSAAQKKVYNRLHACYLCEMCAFLESELPRHYVRAAAGMGDRLLAQARALVEAERRHATMFLALARRLSPELYADRKWIFVRTSAFLSARAFPTGPVLLWIAMIQEERGVFYAEQILRRAEELDAQVVAVHRSHLADEADHLSFGESLLPQYWGKSPPWVRRLNAWLFRYVLREFLSAPNRSGMRMIDYLVLECPELAPRKAELRGALRALDRDPGFHASLYSRKIVPRTFALFDRYTEFHNLGRKVWSYSPEAPR